MCGIEQKKRHNRSLLTKQKQRLSFLLKQVEVDLEGRLDGAHSANPVNRNYWLVPHACLVCHSSRSEFILSTVPDRTNVS